MGRSVQLFERFAEETGQTLHDPGLRAQGYLWLARTAATAARQRQLVERQRGWGVDGVELLTGDEARGRFAWVPDDVVQALGSSDTRQYYAVKALHHKSTGVRRNALAVIRPSAGAVNAIYESGVLDDADPQVRLAALLALSELLTRPGGWVARLGGRRQRWCCGTCRRCRATRP